MSKKHETMDKILSDDDFDDIKNMPLTTYEEYKKYNLAARKANKKLKRCEYPCKPCPEDLHPKERIVFGRVDQPGNPLPVHLSNHLIDFSKKLIPGKKYDLPRVVINYLSEKGVPVYRRITNVDGSEDTVISHKDPRFSLRAVYEE